MTTPGRLEILMRDVGVRRGGRWVLRSLSLHLRGAERLALVGANGAGKTQFLKLLAGDVWPTPTGREELVYRADGRVVPRTEAKPRIEHLGAERQDKYARYGWDLRVADLIATGLHGTDLLLQPVSPRQRRRVAAMLRACRLTRLAARPFLSLSYGQKRLALLARALIRGPDWLLLDEIYNGLDDEFRARIDRVLDLARRRGQAWIAAAHRESDVPRGTTRLMELKDGRIHRTEPLRRAALQRFMRDGAPPAAGAARVRRRPGKVLLRLADVDLYVDYRPVLRGVNWQLRAGEHWAVYGANGAGKSSFLRLLYGDLLPAQGGCIERSGFPRGTQIEDWKKTIGFVSPELQSDYAIDVSIADLVASGRHASIGLVAAPSAADRRAALRWLAFFGLSQAASRRPRELSYGQMRRALIARALAAQPRILLLDEPLTGLDPQQRALVKRLLERLMRRRVTLVIAVHHAADLPRGIARHLRLHKRQACSDDGDSAM